MAQSQWNACALPALSFQQVGRSLSTDDSEFLVFLFWSSVKAGDCSAQLDQILFRLELYHLVQFFREKGIQLIAFGNLST